MPHSSRSTSALPPELRETFLRLSEAQAATQAALREVSAEVKSVAAANKTLQKLYGGMANNRGDETEEFFYDALVQEPVIGDLKFNKVLAHVSVGAKGKQTEIDLVLVNGNSLALVEVKNKCHAQDLVQLEKHITLLRKHSPEYKGFKFYGGIAGFSIPNDVVKAAHEQGYFVLKRHGKVLASNTAGMVAH